MSERTFSKKVVGKQCDICGKEIDTPRYNGTWQHLIPSEKSELAQQGDHTFPLSFRWLKKNTKTTFPRAYHIRYDFHPECFAKNVEKLFPKAKKQLEETTK